MTDPTVFFGGEDSEPGTWESSRFVVLPAPMELTVSYGRGTRHAPRSILEASAELELFDEEQGAPYWRSGEVFTAVPPALPMTAAGAVDAIAEAATKPVESGKFLLTLGGEHTVTAGAVRPVARHHVDLGLLVIDAHLDLRNCYLNERWSHACVMRRVWEEHALPTVWCGVRSYSQEEAEWVSQARLPLFPAHRLDPGGAWIEKVVACLPPCVYVSLDVDGLDPSVIPGTGTPEPGGLSYRDVVRLLSRTAEDRRIVAADIVELAPIPGQQVSEFTAARLAAKLLGAVRRSTP